MRIKLIYLLLSIFFAFSCGQKRTEGLREAEIISLQQKSIVPAKGKLIDPKTVDVPKKVIVGVPKVIAANHSKTYNISTKIYETGELNVVKVSENLTKFTLGSKATPQPIQHIIYGKVSTAFQPDITTAQLPQYNPNTIVDLRYLDVDQGLSSSYIYSIVKGRKGNIWFGTNGAGVCRYDGKSFASYTTKEGLCDNYVESITEDSKGNLWFGTRVGLSKYNGATFTNYTENQGLVNDYVTSTMEDSNGNLWFGTRGGLGMINGNHYVHYTEKEGLPDNHITSIAEDSNGTLWFGTWKGVCSFNGKTFTQYLTKDGLSNGFIVSMLADSKGNIWIGTQGGVNKFDGTAFTHYTEKEGLSNNIVTSIIEDSNGNIWLGTRGGGINKYDGVAFTHYTENEGLTNNFVLSIMDDDEGSIWLGTRGGGVNRYNENTFVHYTENEGLSNNFVISIKEDSKGNLWFGTRGGGVNKYDGTAFTHYTKKEGLNDNSIWSILEDSKGNLWFGTSEGGVNKYDGKTFTYFTTKEGLSSNYVPSMMEDSDGNLWFGTYGSGVNKYDGKTFTHYTEKEGLTNDIVYVMIEDSKGNLWFGTRNGLTMFNGETFTQYTENEGLSNNIVHSIEEGRNGNLWIGTDAGIDSFDGKNFTRFTEENGLSNDLVWSVKEDKDGNLWVSTENGINLLIPLSENTRQAQNTLNYQVYSFDKYDGLKRLDFYGNSVYLDSKDRIWWGSGKNLTMLNLNKFRLNDQPPCIQLNDIAISQASIDFRRLKNATYRKGFPFGEKLKTAFDTVVAFYNYPGNLKLPHTIDHLTFNFSAIDWSAPHKVRYRYKLEGLNEEWSIPSADNRADYRNIPYGDYIFKVKAIGNAQLWSDTFEYAITIFPPWWKTWWFRSLIGLLSITFVLFIIHIQTANVKRRNRYLKNEISERKKAQNEREKLIAEMELKNQELEKRNAEMERFNYTVSHDLKSPLITIAGFLGVVEEDLNANDDQAVRNGLVHINQAVSNMDDLLNNLLELSKAGHDKNDFQEVSVKDLIDEAVFNVQKQLEETSLNINIETFEVWCDKKRMVEVLQNLLENAIKFKSHANNLSIEIGGKEEDDQVKLFVKDNGIGIKKELQHKVFDIFERLDPEIEGTGIGLAIVKRVVEVHGGKIWIESKGEEMGTTFYITLPKINTDNSENGSS